MEQFTFDQLPLAVSKLFDKLNNIEELLREGSHKEPEADLPLNISQAAKLLDLSVPTIYSKVCRREIPVNKQGKRLYFYKSELIEWIRSGRKKTSIELYQQTEQKLASNRKKSH